MRKTFQLTHPKIKVPRLVESAKHEIRKYLKRERRRELPEGVDFLDFDCRFGPTQDEATELHLAEITKRIDEAEAKHLTSFYVEILAKHGHRSKKPKPDTPETPDTPEAPEPPETPATPPVSHE